MSWSSKIGPRFSLRTLLVVTALAAAGCYWLIFPTIIARRFVDAVASPNYEHADDFLDPADRFLLDWNEKHWRFQARAELEPWSFKEFLSGKRTVKLHVLYGDAGPIRSLAWIITATRGGLLKPQQVFAGGSGGGAIDTPLIPAAPTS